MITRHSIKSSAALLFQYLLENTHLQNYCIRQWSISFASTLLSVQKYISTILYVYEVNNIKIWCNFELTSSAFSINKINKKIPKICFKNYI